MPAYNSVQFAPAAPIAKVTIRDPDRGVMISDVSMLIDSGADASLLPRSAVAALGLATTGERYRLETFDGTASESESVRADLIFLNKTFHGHFLQIEGEIGVLGRNILNHVRLLLDGPARNWEEWPHPQGGGRRP